MEVYLLRHAETYNNKYGLSTIDVGLTPDGIKQANRLSGEFDLVIISPLRRTMETFKHSEIKTKTLVTWDCCREVICDPSDCLHGEIFEIEQEESVVQRLTEFLNKLEFLKGTYPINKKILVITHGFIILRLTGRMLDNAEYIKFIN